MALDSYPGSPALWRGASLSLLDLLRAGTHPVFPLGELPSEEGCCFSGSGLPLVPISHIRLHRAARYSEVTETAGYAFPDPRLSRLEFLEEPGLQGFGFLFEASARVRTQELHEGENPLVLA